MPATTPRERGGERRGPLPEWSAAADKGSSNGAAPRHGGKDPMRKAASRGASSDKSDLYTRLRGKLKPSSEAHLTNPNRTISLIRKETKAVG